MAISSSAYIAGRKKYARPQAMLWSENPGTFQNGVWFPSGIEGEDFIVLSDHNRSEMNISQQRIETRQRMINGTMRSYYIADKLSLSTGWTRLPSRSFSGDNIFDSVGQPNPSLEEYTVDGGAGGVQLLDWYENHQGPFWVYLAYDKHNNFNQNEFDRLNIYNDIRLMYFSSFEHVIEKRSGIFDFWNVSVSLEEA